MKTVKIKYLLPVIQYTGLSAEIIFRAAIVDVVQNMQYLGAGQRLSVGLSNLGDQIDNARIVPCKLDGGGCC